MELLYPAGEVGGGGVAVESGAGWSGVGSEGLLGGEDATHSSTLDSLSFDATECYLPYPAGEAVQYHTALWRGQPSLAGGDSHGVDDGPCERRGRDGRWG
jgi:hypothetical protein